MQETLLGSSAGLHLLHVDDDLVVVSKPSGMLVHKGWARDGEIALQTVRDLVGSYVYPVHRLDRAASGLLVFARTAEAASALGRAFASQAIEKIYLALVRGQTPEAGVIDHPVPRVEGGERVAARTSFRSLGFSARSRCSLVEVQLHSGRLHQIRRHFKHISHPLVGDVRYGKGDVNRLFRERHGLHRLALHAHRLVFTHPASAAVVGFCAEPRGPLAETLLELELWPCPKQDP